MTVKAHKNIMISNDFNMVEYKFLSDSLRINKKKRQNDEHISLIKNEYEGDYYESFKLWIVKL
ncbi:MAG: hypothetical protein JG775_850 [Defluviitaleaceae bacterium]|jgi:hypothetical protein|nr:hypothetical protein [Defluviitaleaceae bacterium]